MLELGKITDKTLNEMKTHYPPTYVIGNDNPTDVIGGACTDDYRYAIKRFTDDPHIDIIMPWFVFQDEPLEEKIIYYLGEFSEQGRKPLLVGGNGAPYTNKISRLIEKHHIPVYDDIRNWVAAAAALYNLYNWGKQKNSHHA